MRRFQVWRTEDVSGVSGTGVVAEGVEFTNGSVCVSWMGELTSIEVHKSVDNFIAIHGHGGKTNVVWMDLSGDVHQPEPRPSLNGLLPGCELCGHNLDDCKCNWCGWCRRDLTDCDCIW